ncbi:UNKNOWN [Stylonychia lemnae]|uniref:Uncharacterized protein n=1 Tax=Stylonychia lemnae TaxID=5949 RepID=A0A078AP80_STYLE|nr:UNKNOWN [Stylonychia lemnae]|eukprot:CDW83127.1 UNKNOWN [Stylonychia lemnae]
MKKAESEKRKCKNEEEEEYQNYIDNDFAFREDNIEEIEYRKKKDNYIAIDKNLLDYKHNTQSIKSHHVKGKLSEYSQNPAESHKQRQKSQNQDEINSNKSPRVIIPTTLQTVERVLTKSNSNDNLSRIHKGPLSQRSNNSNQSNQTDVNSRVKQQLKYAKKLIAERRVRSIQNQFQQQYQQQSQNEPQLPQFITSGNNQDFSFGGYHQSANIKSYRGSLLDPQYPTSDDGSSQGKRSAKSQNEQSLNHLPKSKRRVVKERKMHTPIDELQEEDEISINDNLSDDEYDDAQGLEEQQERQERQNSKARNTQTPSFVENSGGQASNIPNIHIPNPITNNKMEDLNEYYKKNTVSPKPMVSKDQIKDFQKNFKRKILLKQIIKNNEIIRKDDEIKIPIERPKSCDKVSSGTQNVNIYIGNYTNLNIDPQVFYHPQQQQVDQQDLNSILQNSMAQAIPQQNTLNLKIQELAKKQALNSQTSSLLKKFQKIQSKQITKTMQSQEVFDMPTASQAQNTIQNMTRNDFLSQNSSNFNHILFSSGSMSARTNNKSQRGEIQSNLKQVQYKQNQPFVKTLNAQGSQSNLSKVKSQIMGESIGRQSVNMQQQNNVLQNVSSLNNITQTLNKGITTRNQAYQCGNLTARPSTQVKQRPVTKNSYGILYQSTTSIGQTQSKVIVTGGVPLTSRAGERYQGEDINRVSKGSSSRNRRASNKQQSSSNSNLNLD